jgi:hypothetical protein
MRCKRIWVLALVCLFALGCGSDEGSADNDAEGFDLRDDANISVEADSGSPDVGVDTDEEGDADVAEVAGEPVGAPCSSDAECAHGRCLQSDAFAGGYCSTPDNCQFDNHCPDEVSCSYSEDFGSVCMQRCRGDDECRDGYTCQDSSASPFDVCAPYIEPTGLDDGEPCQEDDECMGGTCIPHPRWPQGYCTTLDCDNRDDCAREDHDNRCLIGGQGYDLCVRMCDSAADCRDDYVCQPVGGGQGYCAPDNSIQLGLDDLDDYPFDVTCELSAQNSSLSIDYEIADDTTSYMITPLARDGERLRPTSITLPDQETVSFSGENGFQTIPSQLFGFINPLVMPAIEDFIGQLQSGAHTLELRTDSQDLCYYLLEEESAGTTIDFNIYLVGVPGLDAQSAGSDADMQAVLDAFDTIYAQTDVSIGSVSYHDIDGDEADAYQVIRRQNDLHQLVSLSERPEGGYDEVLSANIFFVRSMELGGGGGGGGAIGVSQGLPGAAALHGTPSSGVVFTSEYMGHQMRGEDGDWIDGNELTGIVLAHEVGHYLGLFHTSEQYNQGYDPIDDTPECTSGFPESCPDLGNLMFPLAGISHTEVTAGQSFVLKANPLTKE